MAKRLQLRRHTDKDGEQASQAGLDLFYESFSPITDHMSVTDLFCGSELGRTAQTALAAVCAHGIRARVHVPDKRFGTSRLFSGWKEKGLIEAAQQAGSLLKAVKSILKDEEMEALRSDLLAVVKECFDKVRPEGHGVAYLHSPIVELIAENHGFDMSDVQLGSCEGVMLELDEEGIRVVEILRVERPSD